jgi:uncharacterized membrane protein YfcA
MTIHEARLQALDEVKRDTVDQEQWLKAFAHSDGQRESTVARYVLFRSEKILAVARASEVKQVAAATTSAIKRTLRFGVKFVALIALFISGGVVGAIVSVVMREYLDADPLLWIPYVGMVILLGVALFLGFRKLFPRRNTECAEPPLQDDPNSPVSPG